MKINLVSVHNLQMSDHLVATIEYIKEKYPEGKYLYKSCDKKWIVVLETISGSITNQTRLTVDYPTRKFAKFRSNKLKVIDIIDKFDHTKTINSVKNSVYTEKAKIEYVKGTIVESDSFDMDLITVCSNGIHFFESVEPAFYYELDDRNYTGHYKSWHDDGQKWQEGDYLDGKRTGHWISWYSNGQKKEEGDYIGWNKIY